MKIHETNTTLMRRNM